MELPIDTFKRAIAEGRKQRWRRSRPSRVWTVASSVRPTWPALGHLGNNRHPEVRAAIEQLGARALKAGTPIGILATVEADAKAFFEMGFTFVAVASDLGLLRQATDDIVARFRTENREP